MFLPIEKVTLVFLHFPPICINRLWKRREYGCCQHIGERSRCFIGCSCKVLAPIIWEARSLASRLSKPVTPLPIMSLHIFFSFLSISLLSPPLSPPLPLSSPPFSFLRGDNSGLDPRYLHTRLEVHFRGYFFSGCMAVFAKSVSSFIILT